MCTALIKGYEHKQLRNAAKNSQVGVNFYDRCYVFVNNDYFLAAVTSSFYLIQPKFQCLFFTYMVSLPGCFIKHFKCIFVTYIPFTFELFERKCLSEMYVL